MDEGAPKKSKCEEDEENVEDDETVVKKLSCFAKPSDGFTYPLSCLVLLGSLDGMCYRCQTVFLDSGKGTIRDRFGIVILFDKGSECSIVGIFRFHQSVTKS